MSFSAVGCSHEDFLFVLSLFFGLFDLEKQRGLSLFVWRKRCTLRTILNAEDEECFVDSVQRAGGYFFNMTVYGCDRSHVLFCFL